LGVVFGNGKKTKHINGEVALKRELKDNFS
jgi:hypothetical protein